MKKDTSKNKHIAHAKKVNKLQLKFHDANYTIVKTNHLFDIRTKDKQRDQFISDDIYKQISKLTLMNGLTSFREKGPIAVTLANSRKKEYSCTCFLFALNKYNQISIISAIQTYGRKKWYRGFMKVQNRITLFPNIYVIPRLSDKEIDIKKKDKIFNHNTEEAYQEDKIFLQYAKYNKI